jgi:hypothetical protein
LYGVKLADPWTLAGVIASIFAVAFVACWIRSRARQSIRFPAFAQVVRGFSPGCLRGYFSLIFFDARAGQSVNRSPLTFEMRGRVAGDRHRVTLLPYA